MIVQIYDGRLGLPISSFELATIFSLFRNRYCIILDMGYISIVIYHHLYCHIPSSLLSYIIIYIYLSRSNTAFGLLKAIYN